MAPEEGRPVDRIELEGIEVWAHHGVLPHERQLGQPFVIDVVLHMDLASAAASDDLADTVDYGTLAARVRDAATGGPHQLVETVAGRVLDACIEDPRVQEAEVTVHKPSAPMPVPAADVRVVLSRRR